MTQEEDGNDQQAGLLSLGRRVPYGLANFASRSRPFKDLVGILDLVIARVFPEADGCLKLVILISRTIDKLCFGQVAEQQFADRRDGIAFRFTVGQRAQHRLGKLAERQFHNVELGS